MLSHLEYFKNLLMKRSSKHNILMASSFKMASFNNDIRLVVHLSACVLKYVQTILNTGIFGTGNCETECGA